VSPAPAPAPADGGRRPAAPTSTVVPAAPLVPPAPVSRAGPLALGSPPPAASSAAPAPAGSGPLRPIRVLVADDQHLVRGALVALLGLESDIDVVAEVARGDEVVSAARASSPDVALLDVQMPGVDGLAAAASLRRELPTCRVLVVTTFARPGYLRRALEAGASGYMVKDAAPAALADAVRRVHAGLRVVDPELAAESLAAGENPLTARERDVLVAARDGSTVAAVAGRLFLSEGTVRNYMSAAIGKTGTRTRAEAIGVADRNGWL